MFDKQQPIQKNKLHDQVYNRLCTMLRQGEFTPGEPVPVAHIADAFGISPMPVREALARLLAKAALAQDISWSYEDLISPLSRETSVEK